jgi:hypothetical protein
MDLEKTLDALIEQLNEEIEKELALAETDEKIKKLEEETEEKLEEVNRIKFDRKTQITQLANKRAIYIAKTKGDPLYKRYKKAIDLKNKMEAMIVKKYKQQARSEVIKALSSSNTSKNNSSNSKK